MVMGAQANNYRLVNTDEFPDTVGDREVRKIVANVALEHSKGQYAQRPATYMEAVVRAFRNQNVLNISKDEPMSEGKLATLYLIDKAYDQFILLLDLLKSMGEYRFELKRYAKDIEKVFNQYQRLRDKNSFIDPILFSDIMDVYEEKYSAHVDALKALINDSLHENDALSDDWRKLISLILLIDGFIMCAEFNRDYISDRLTMSFICSFKIFEFVDFKCAEAASRRVIHAINKRMRTDVQFTDDVSAGFQQLCKTLLLDKDIVKQIKFMKDETGN